MRTQRLLAPASVARRAVWQLVAVSAIAGALLVGCPGSLDNPSQFSEGVGDGSAGTGGGGSGGSGGSPVECDIPVAMVPEQLFTPTCATSSCHDTSMPAGELDLISPDLPSRLLDQPSSQCPVEILVDSATPENSLLLDKVTNAAPGCGDRMPLGGSLPPEEIACVRAWIELITGGGGQPDAATDSAGD